ncbi:thioredoxin family protein [Aquabacterium sp.]|uniref:thioredoxin family protein n=1 Tax=Aquabacterium sp. TaxID=1872578 RepID=UPI002C55D70F|nr:thioredoxin family protein [Aquabacterium sp.]HSW08146.1 thioredoxin family protein [Aquabacterium sp.]
MKPSIHRWSFLGTLALGLAATGLAHAQAVVGQPAPAFKVTDTTGKAVSLADFKGKHVVLEWVNPGCPFVQKHYDSGNMPATQKSARAKEVVWLSVSSTSRDAGDYKAPADLAGWLQRKGAGPSATLMDDDGKLGRSYGARTTPHMYVIDPQGKLIYAGAIDSKPSSDVADIKTATNYVNQALGEALAGKPVSKATTQAYGCSIKYASGA